MKTTKIKSFSLAILLLAFLFNINANAQDGSLPTEITSIVKMTLEGGQNKLASLGYEICYSSLFSKKEDWFNESTKSCVTVKFDKKKIITEVLQNTDISECQKGLEASRKVWEKYHDGQAPVSTPKIDEERKKLADQGFKVSYWVNEVSPGRNSEYWVNDVTQKTMFIVWEIQDNKWVMTDKTDYQMGKNPAPNK
jgi:hypothetical protein